MQKKHTDPQVKRQIRKNKPFLLSRISKNLIVFCMLFAGLLLSVLLVSSQTSLGSRANQVTWLPGAETVTFQNGTSNYTGTRDSFIAQSTPNKNYAGNAKIQVKS